MYFVGTKGPLGRALRDVRAPTPAEVLPNGNNRKNSSADEAQRRRSHFSTAPTEPRKRASPGAKGHGGPPLVRASVTARPASFGACACCACCACSKERGGAASKNRRKDRVPNVKLQERKKIKNGSNNLEIDQGSQ